MIVYRRWRKETKGLFDTEYRHYDGWFLFGFIPLYIRRIA